MSGKTLESPLDCKKIQRVNPKGYQSWIFIGRTDAKAETPNILATWCKEVTHLKRPWIWDRLKEGGEGDNRGWDAWMASPTLLTWVWVSSGVGDGQGILASCSPWSCKESDTHNWATELKWCNFGAPWTLAHLSLGDLPNPGIKQLSPALQRDFLLSEPECIKPIKISSFWVAIWPFIFQWNSFETEEWVLKQLID